MKEKALLVTVDFYSVQRSSRMSDLVAELAELSQGAGLTVVGNLLFKQDSPSSAIFLGKGQAEKIRLEAKKHLASVVVFESNLTPSQQRNLEEIIGVKTIDRTQLILDIFARRARSTEGKLQVELAQLKYLLPRLGGQGIYLSRLGGGVGTRGPGEQKLEVDRRRIREKISHLTADLKELEVKRQRLVGNKKENDLPLVALAGYTNAGKSTLFNHLTRSQVIAKNQLFSTLDTTTRLLEMPRKQKALLSDTVGFIRDLPHNLVESFKATLEEAVQADILWHVMDASREDLRTVCTAVYQVLTEIGAGERKVFLIFNKSDLVPLSERGRVSSMISFLHAGPVFWVSATTGEGILELLQATASYFSETKVLREFFFSQEKIAAAGVLYREAEVVERRDTAEGVFLKAYTSEKLAGKLAPYAHEK